MAVPAYASKDLHVDGLGLGITGMMLLSRSWPITDKFTKTTSYPKNLDNSSGYEDWKRQWEKKMSGYDDWKRRWEARLNKKPAS